MLSTGPARIRPNQLSFTELRTGGMGQQILWEDMEALERLAAIRELAEQLKALRDDRARRQEADGSQPTQSRPSARSRLGNAFLLSTAIPLDHSTACFHLPRHPTWNLGVRSFPSPKTPVLSRNGQAATALHV
jgi:hypothetical protein